MMTADLRFTTSFDRFQARFVPLLTEARRLPLLLGEVIERDFPSGTPGVEMPAATVERLLVATYPLYHAAIATLAEPETTLGSLALMRSLIETWAHLYFIAGDDLLKDAACRALRIEAGFAAHMVSLARTAGSEMVDQLAVAEERERLVEGLSRDLGCRGARRDYSKVQSTLKQIQNRFGMDWLVPTYASASMVAHVGGSDWVLEDWGDGTSALVYSRPSYRASSFNHVVLLFANVGDTAIYVRGCTSGESFHVATHRLLDDRFLKRAIDGDYD